MARLIQLNGVQQGRVIDLVTGRWRMGRNPENEIRIDDQGISSFHAELQVAEIGLHLKDMGSTNGVFVDGRPFVRGMLLNGQTLQIGVLEFKVELKTAEIVVNVPQAVEQRFANFLEDGTPACQIHADVVAAFQCSKCGITLCPACVRRTGLAGSVSLYFCLECSGKCVEMEQTERVASKKSAIPGLSKLSDTLHLARPIFMDFMKGKKK